MEQDYVYYAPVRLSKHALYAAELSRMLHHDFGWHVHKKGNGYTEPDLIVRAFVKRCEENDDRVQTSLFYNARSGLSRVYLYGEEYIEELNRLLVSVEKEDDDGKHFISELTIGKTKYVVYRDKE